MFLTVWQTGAAPMPAPESIPADAARRLVLHAQGLLGAPPRGRPAQRVDAMLRRLGAVQLDTISVLARSHELVAFARLGAVGRGAVETAYWGSGRAFEYWAHAACVLPVESWPWFAVKRRRYRGGVQVHGEPLGDGVRREALARVRDLGPVSFGRAETAVAAGDLGGARQGGPWWDWSPIKVAVEQLLAEGEVVCVTRQGWRRVYDLAERAIPAELLVQDWSDEECAAALCGAACRALGVASLADIADYFRIGRLGAGFARMGVAAAGLVPLRVEGWKQPAWVHPDWLALLDTPPRGRHRTTLVSPFDSLVWFRPRAERIFGFKPRLELYVPKAKRLHGYFSMPLLSGGRLRGHADPAREGRTLVARNVAVAARDVEPMAAALAEAAAWTGCDAVAVEAVDPPALRGALDAAVRHIS